MIFLILIFILYLSLTAVCGKNNVSPDGRKFAPGRIQKGICAEDAPFFCKTKFRAPDCDVCSGSSACGLRIK